MLNKKGEITLLVYSGNLIVMDAFLSATIGLFFSYQAFNEI